MGQTRCKCCNREVGQRFHCGLCGACYSKLPAIARFARVRDDFRQKCGMSRMTKGSEYYDG